jgi:hypothetical protein
MPDDRKKQNYSIEDLVRVAVDWIVAIVPGVLIFHALRSWEIALVVTWFFYRLEILSRS